ncbi:MAG: TlpA disulfide reductase family protein [Niabella sp.]
MQAKKKFFSFSNITTALLAIFVVAMLISPDVKAWAIQGLMKVGLFQPGVESASATPNETPKEWDVNMVDGKGDTITGSSLKGKVVFVNVWATWCPPCIAEMPSIGKLYQKFKNNPDVMFLLVDADNNMKKANRFLNRRKLDLPVHNSNMELPAEWFQGSLPTTVILDKAGNIVYRHVGAADYGNEKFARFLDGLLQ